MKEDNKQKRRDVDRKEVDKRKDETGRDSP